MALFVRRTALISIPGIGTIKVVPKGGRDVAITAPEALDITDKKGRPMSCNRRKDLTKRRTRE